MKPLQRLRDLNIGAKIVGLVLFLTLIAATIGGVGLTRMQAVGHNLEDLVSGGLPLTSALRRMQAAQLEQGILVERALRLPYMLVSDKDQRLARIEKGFREHGEHVRSAMARGQEGLQALEGEQAQRLRRSLNAIGSLQEAYEKRAQAVLTTIQESGSPQLARKKVPAVREARENLDQATSDLADEIGAFTQGTASKTASLERSGVVVIGGVAALGLGAGLAFGLWLAVEISGPLRRAHETITAVARQGDLSLRLPVRSRDEVGRLASDFNHLAEEFEAFVAKVGGKTSQLTSANEQLSATAGEIASSATSSAQHVDQVTASARDVNGVVQEVAHTITGVSESADGAAATVQEGKQAVERASQRLEHLKGATEQVEQINDSIAAIAKKTDLLALNAAIEAANAGEAGQGFAVVADEVRQLSEQTATATSQVKSMVVDLEGQSEASVAAMQEVQGLMDRILTTVEATRKSANRIAASAEELAATMGETTESMAEINSRVDSVTGSVGEIQEAAGFLGRLSTDLDDSMQRFRTAEAAA
jgi:methyl-accepting chemotaxis protein